MLASCGASESAQPTSLIGCLYELGRLDPDAIYEWDPLAAEAVVWRCEPDVVDAKEEELQRVRCERYEPGERLPPACIALGYRPDGG